MRLVTFLHCGETCLGALSSEKAGQMVVDLNRADGRLPSDMISFLEAGETARALAEQALAAPPPEATLKPSDVTLKAPILRPGKIICIGQNYLEHAHESNADAPPFPIIFAKYANSVIGHGEPIVIPAAVEKPDYEGELAVVIGRRGRKLRGCQKRSQQREAQCGFPLHRTDILLCIRNRSAA